MSPAPTHAPLSYNKWDHFGDDEEDAGGASEPATPMLASTKAEAQIDHDNELYERFRAHLKTYFKGKYPLAQRKLVARFIAVAHEGDEATNAFRYPDIMGLSTQVAALCPRGTAFRPPPRFPRALAAPSRAHGPRVHRADVRAAQEDDQRRQSRRAHRPARPRWQGARPAPARRTDRAPPRSAAPHVVPRRVHAQIVICAINTLEAMQRHRPMNSLFESICYPSSSESAKEIYTKCAAPHAPLTARRAT